MLFRSDPDQFHTVVDDVTARYFQRNRYLIDFDYIPDVVKNNITAEYQNQPRKDKSQLLNYFMEHRMKNLMDDRQAITDPAPASRVHHQDNAGVFTGASQRRRASSVSAVNVIEQPAISSEVT